jgi:hypothetical protein
VIDGESNPRRRAVTAAAALGALTVAVAGMLATPPAASSAIKACGHVSFTQRGKTYAYSVRRDKGLTTCIRARTVMRAFLITAASPRGWFCVRGHASQHQRWAATCAAGGGAIVRAFGPLKT